MEKKLLISFGKRKQKQKEIFILDSPEKLKLLLNPLSWQILSLLTEKEMYPLEIAKKLGIHEQKAYYHIRKLAKAGAIKIVREEVKKGATAKYYRAVATAFGVEFPVGYSEIPKTVFPAPLAEKLKKFFTPLVVKDKSFNGKIVVGSPIPHGPFKTSARDGHYAAYLTFFLGQFCKLPEEFAVKLDVDVKAEKEEKNNMILVGGPGTNLLTQEVNRFLPIRFDMRASEHGFLFGGLVSEKTGNVYTADTVGLIAKIINPWDKNKRVIVLAGNKAVGTKACVLAITKFWEKTLRKYSGDDYFAVVIQGFDLDGDGKVDSIEVLE